MTTNLTSKLSSSYHNHESVHLIVLNASGQVIMDAKILYRFKILNL